MVTHGVRELVSNYSIITSYLSAWRRNVLVYNNFQRAYLDGTNRPKNYRKTDVSQKWGVASKGTARTPRKG